MNKTIIINMNGIIFHIEEDAYETLKAYMLGVKRHFAYTTDSEEIVTDIENRIAEMFTELLEEQKKQVVVLKDVQEITAQMGSVSDFESAEGEETHINEPFLKTGKKLYRDTEERVIGGVCAGIAHYFGLDAKWVRLIFVLLLIFGGSGILIYLIFLIVMPKAITRTARMEMRGETINLQNFKKNLDEELGSLKSNATVGRAGSIIAKMFSVAAALLTHVARIFIKAISVLIILTGVIALVAAFLGLFTLLGLMNQRESELFFIAAINPEYQSGIYFSAFVLIVIPIIALTLFAVRVLTNYKIITRTGSFAMLIIWLTGLGAGIFYGTRLASEFVEEAAYTKVVDIKPSPVYYLNLDESAEFTSEDSVKFKIEKNGRNKISINRGHNIHIPDMQLLIEESEDLKTPTLTERYSSHGPDFEAALALAQQLRYRFSQADSVLKFSRGSIGKKQLWRDQEIRLVLRVPKNTRLIIDGSMDYDYIRNYSLWSCRPDGSNENAPTEWIMTDEGLKCKNRMLEEGVEKQESEQ